MYIIEKMENTILKYCRKLQICFFLPNSFFCRKFLLHYVFSETFYMFNIWDFYQQLIHLMCKVFSATDRHVKNGVGTKGKRKESMSGRKMGAESGAEEWERQAALHSIITSISLDEHLRKSFWTVLYLPPLQFAILKKIIFT